MDCFPLSTNIIWKYFKTEELLKYSYVVANYFYRILLRWNAGNGRVASIFFFYFCSFSAEINEHNSDAGIGLSESL